MDVGRGEHKCDQIGDFSRFMIDLPLSIER